MSSSTSQRRRISKGRQKVAMAKMENQGNLQVTFSKRRAGLFKKASELCTLCGADAIIVVFSPANKAYCFAHPNTKTVLDKFLVGTNNVEHHHNNHVATRLDMATSELIIQAHRNSTIRELNLELTQVESMLRAEKRHSEELEMIRKVGTMQRWFPGSLDKFNYEQLSVLKEAIMGFKKVFDEKVQRDMIGLNHAYNTPPIAYANEGLVGNPNCNFWPWGELNALHHPSLGPNDLPQFGDKSLGFVTHDDGDNNFFNPVVAHTMSCEPPTVGQTPMFFLGGVNGSMEQQRRLPSFGEVSNEVEDKEFDGSSSKFY